MTFDVTCKSTQLRCIGGGVALLWVLTVPVANAALNDTGILQCGDATTYSTATCASVASDTSQYPRQDAVAGRDYAASLNQLPKIGGGAKGFDFTKVANNGNDLAAGAAWGTAPGDWGCVRDNVTGLVWEIKSPNATDLRYKGNTYTWYSSTAYNGGPVGASNGGACTQAGRCDTEKFVADVNTAGLCGASNYPWRLPTYIELQGIMDLGATNPMIDSTYFSDADPSTYWWTGMLVTSDTTAAWAIGMTDGAMYRLAQTSTYRIRLVRGAQ